MSVFASGETDPRVYALLDPFATISYTGILSDDYLEIIKEVFSKFMYPGMVKIPVKYNGNEEIINMPGRITVWNKIFNSKHLTPFDFPLIFSNSEKQHWFYFGNDIMQFLGNKDVYALSSYRDGIISFSIVLINNGWVYVVNINDSADEIQYYKLDSETKDRMQEYFDCGLCCYNNLLGIFGNANIVEKHKEKKENISFVNLVKKLIDECISSPSQITSKLSEEYLTSKPLTQEFNLPGLEVVQIPNKIRDTSIQAGKLIEYDKGVCSYREDLNDYEEFFVFIPPKVTGEVADFLWWYAKIEKNKDDFGNYRVSYYYYDAETVAALEHLCTHHCQFMNFLKLNDATDAGIFPCFISTRLFKTLDDAQAAVTSFYKNPESIMKTKGYVLTLTRSINRIREASQTD